MRTLIICCAAYALLCLLVSKVLCHLCRDDVSSEGEPDALRGEAHMVGVHGPEIFDADA